jgi:hypothetical protein
MVPERNPDRSEEIEAAGERIVAFARSGKPPAIAFLWQAGCAPGSRESPEYSHSGNGS